MWFLSVEGDRQEPEKRRTKGEKREGSAFYGLRKKETERCVMRRTLQGNHVGWSHEVSAQKCRGGEKGRKKQKGGAGRLTQRNQDPRLFESVLKRGEPYI